MPRGAVVVGRNTAASCTAAALEGAVRRVVARGSGTVSFACGPRPVRITLNRPLAFTGTATSRYAMDGRRMVTLDGANRTGLVHLPNVQGLSATFRNLSFIRARAAHQGAAIHGGWRNRLLVENCSFTGNTATSVRQGAFDGGGALFVHEGRATVRRSTFVGNTALNGGAIQNTIGDLVVERSTFRRNRAAVSGKLGGGGALASDSGSLVVRFSSISGNTAGAGGGLFVWNAKGKVSRIQDSVISANTATGRRDSGFGGGIRNGTGPLVIERVTLSRNVAGLQGGGLYNADDADVRVLRTRFLGNRAGSGGGAIFRVSGTIATSGCTFRGNTPGDQR
jgi:predicted outer membrane repeat protein